MVSGQDKFTSRVGAEKAAAKESLQHRSVSFADLHNLSDADLVPADPDPDPKRDTESPEPTTPAAIQAADQLVADLDFLDGLLRKDDTTILAVVRHHLGNRVGPTPARVIRYLSQVSRARGCFTHRLAQRTLEKSSIGRTRTPIRRALTMLEHAGLITVTKLDGERQQIQLHISRFVEYVIETETVATDEYLTREGNLVADPRTYRLSEPSSTDHDHLTRGSCTAIGLTYGPDPSPSQIKRTLRRVKQERATFKFISRRRAEHQESFVTQIERRIGKGA